MDVRFFPSYQLHRPRASY